MNLKLKQLLLEDFFDETLINISRKLNYSDENILIISYKDEEIYKGYNDVIENLKSCNHNRDSRELLEYARELVFSWIFEDYILLNLSIFDLVVTLNGKDSERKILSTSKVKTDDDLEITYQGKKIHCEIVIDYGGYWSNRKTIELRDNKFKKMVDRSKNNLELLLGFDLKNKMYFLVNINQNTNATFIPFHYPFQKPAYSLKIFKADLKEFKFYNVANDIKKFF